MSMIEMINIYIQSTGKHVHACNILFEQVTNNYTNLRDNNYAQIPTYLHYLTTLYALNVSIRIVTGMLQWVIYFN